MATSTPVNIAVVGHANTGKTSLIRTLLRDSQFGEVADYAGTTRQVEAVAIQVAQQDVIRLYDTPGIEDSIALLQAWHTSDAAQQPISLPDKLSRFIQHLEQDKNFEQEIKVFKQAYQSDLLLYVIDARLPYLGKFQDELSLLTLLGKPLIPVLNFIQDDPENVTLWRQQLQQANLHAMVEYDTVAFTFEAERRLYTKMQSLLESRFDQFAAVLQQREASFARSIESSAQAIADLVIDASTYRQAMTPETEQHVMTMMQSRLRQREEQCIEQVLHCFGFNKHDINATSIPIQNGKWERDLFDPNTLKTFGINTSNDAAKGAVVGGGIDLMVGGLSLGAGAAIGAAAGALLGMANRYGKAVWDTISGVRYACIDDLTIALLYRRQSFLLHCLAHRGHATQEALQLNPQMNTNGQTNLTTWLKTLRKKPHWCHLTTPKQTQHARREIMLNTIKAQLVSAL